MATRSLERLSDLPIILATLTGNVTVEDIRLFTDEFTPYFEAIDYQGFLILDITRATANFAQVFHILRWQKGNAPSFAGIRVYLVGLNDLIRLYTDLRAKDPSNASAFSIFRTMEDALAAAHAAVKQMTDLQEI